MSKLMQQPLMQYLAPLKADFLSIALLSLIANLLMLAPTIYMLQLYDRVMMSKNELTLLMVTLLIGIFILAIAFAEWLRSMITIKAGVKLDQSLNSLLFGLAFERAFNQKGVSQQKSASEAMQDLTFIRQFLTSNGLFAFFDMPWTLIYVAVLFILSPSLGWLAVVFCLIQFALGVWNQASTDKPLKASMQAHLENQQFLQSKIRNLETLHVMGILPLLYKRWQSLQTIAETLNSKATKIQGRNQHLNKFTRYTMQSLMLAAAALLAVKGQISIGSMIASNVLIARALQPFDVVVSTWKQTIQAKAAFGRLNALLAMANSASVEVAKVETYAPIKGEIILQNLNVTLQAGSKQVLKDLSVHIPSGQILTIMGPSGSGKTTLARCLVGVIPVEHGALLVDGISIEKINQQQLVSSLGYLPQDIDLIEGSIAENIARFGTLDSLEIIAAAKTVGIHDMILRLPLGYDTKIDESGLSLSGGQSQLVGLARAIYKEPAILVLDEPNAHLDEHGDEHLLKALLALKNKGKTIIVISHRANILKVTDQLLVMRGGEIHHHGPTEIVLSKLNDALLKLKQQAA
ncbi:MAG: type I secretion system permease/ATPase [Methylotenera sp.]|uniref:type I secretion system permease/ATPase n=1 Tax=Methylotenera sp. TaxID=2051956 RepID=UPI002487E4C2|nr:type I secretion system permease/ATPase [Methylotenera sp.]MDI1308943.1 type I secretion system permease/ATPase [Methylotenera sp.]